MFKIALDFLGLFQMGKMSYNQITCNMEANNAEPDQTAQEAVWSGSTMFAYSFIPHSWKEIAPFNPL